MIAHYNAIISGAICLLSAQPPPGAAPVTGSTAAAGAAIETGLVMWNDFSLMRK